MVGAFLPFPFFHFSLLVFTFAVIHSLFPLHGWCIQYSCDVKELLGFFINHVFVGVFQYDSGTLNLGLKYALELKKY